jgi:hypothetical protein
MTETRTARLNTHIRSNWTIGAFALLSACALDIYAAYGDPDPKSDQEAAVPFLVVTAALATLAVFGWLVPKTHQAIGQRRPTAGRWIFGTSFTALLLVPIAFWSGLPIILGAAGAYLAYGARDNERATTPMKAALPLGVTAIAATIALTVVANLVGG